MFSKKVITTTTKKRKKNSLKINLFNEKKRKHKYYQDMITKTENDSKREEKIIRFLYFISFQKFIFIPSKKKKRERNLPIISNGVAKFSFFFDIIILFLLYFQLLIYHLFEIYFNLIIFRGGVEVVVVLTTII